MTRTFRITLQNGDVIEKTFTDPALALEYEGWMRWHRDVTKFEEITE